jgi:hypothetical protein
MIPRAAAPLLSNRPSGGENCETNPDFESESHMRTEAAKRGLAPPGEGASIPSSSLTFSPSPAFYGRMCGGVAVCGVRVDWLNCERLP